MEGSSSSQWLFLVFFLFLLMFSVARFRRGANSAKAVRRPCAAAASALILGLAVCGGHASAQQYPNRTARIVVGFPPGGVNDIIARMLSYKFSESLGQQFVVENRSGASGTIGADAVAKAKPDGYTILLGSVSNLVTATTQYRMPYDSQKDFAPVSQVASSPYVMLVHPSLPAHTLKDFIALAKKNPGKITFSTAGNGSGGHLTTSLLALTTGIDIHHVPYKGDAAAGLAVMTGEITFHFSVLPVALLEINSKKVRPMAVTSAKRTSLAPEVPTFTEAGLNGFEIGVWVGLLLPAGASPEIVSQLHKETIKAIRTADFREKLALQGIDPIGNTPAEFSANIGSELAKWRKAAQAAGITPP